MVACDRIQALHTVMVENALGESVCKVRKEGSLRASGLGGTEVF